MVYFSSTPLPLLHRPGPIHLAAVMPVQPGEFRWRLPDWWALLLVHYEADLTLGGHPLRVTPGMVTFIAPDVPKWCRYDRAGSHHVIHFQAPPAAADAPRVPLAFDPGPLGPAVLERFRLVARTARTSPDRATVALWDLLYLLADVHAPGQPEPVIDRFTAALDERLHTSFSIGDLVRESGYSHNHLLGLFRARHGETIVAYVRRRRMESARSLLATDLPITAIAAQVGIPDLHAFNKTVRRTYGCSPRALRSRLTAAGGAQLVRAESSTAGVARAGQSA